MGRYRDNSDEDRKRKKKKKRSLSRSREGSRESSISSKKSSKHKKKKTHRSRSRSPDKRYSRKRSRSLSRDRVYNRSRSRSGSRGRGRKRYDRRSRSQSWDRVKRRYSRSRSRDRRSRSRDRRDRRSRSSSWDSRLDSMKREKDDPCANVPGFFDMLPAEQAKVRMQLALRAAAAADEKLKEQGVLLNPKSVMSAGELKKFNQSVENIESESFAPSAFLSTRENPLTTEDEDGSGRSKLEKTHDDAIFGLGSGKLDIKLDASERTNVVYTGAASLAHPNLHKTPEEKMGRWLEKLTAMRRRKLEGEAMT